MRTTALTGILQPQHYQNCSFLFCSLFQREIMKTEEDDFKVTKNNRQTKICKLEKNNEKEANIVLHFC